MVMATGAILATGQHQHTDPARVRSGRPDPVRTPAPTMPAPAVPATARARPADPADLDPGVRRSTRRPPGRSRPRLRSPPGSPQPRRAARPDRLPTRPATASTSKPRPRKPAPTTPVSRWPLPPPTPLSPRRSPPSSPCRSPSPAELLARAGQVARQYRTEHGTPITAGQLAVRLKVNSEQASQALAVLDLGPNSPTTPDPDRQRPRRQGAPGDRLHVERRTRSFCFGYGPQRAAGSPSPTGRATPPTSASKPLARAARPDYPAWLSHVKAAAACTRPVRLAGTIATIEAATGRILAQRSTADMPDGVIYKPCGNRREPVCPACSQRYQRDAYQVVRAGLVGGKGVTEQVAHHPAVFPTFTAPGFGEVHTRVVKRHTCSPAHRVRLPPGAVPRPPRLHRLPARAAAGLLRPARRHRPRPRHPAVPGLLRLPRPRPCGTCTPASCGGAPPSPSTATSPDRPPARHPRVPS